MSLEPHNETARRFDPEFLAVAAAGTAGATVNLLGLMPEGAIFNPVDEIDSIVLPLVEAAALILERCHPLNEEDNQLLGALLKWLP